MLLIELNSHELANLVFFRAWLSVLGAHVVKHSSFWMESLFISFLSQEFIHLLLNCISHELSYFGSRSLISVVFYVGILIKDIKSLLNISFLWILHPGFLELLELSWGLIAWLLTHLVVVFWASWVVHDCHSSSSG